MYVGSIHTIWGNCSLCPVQTLWPHPGPLWKILWNRLVDEKLNAIDIMIREYCFVFFRQRTLWSWTYYAKIVCGQTTTWAFISLSHDVACALPPRQTWPCRLRDALHWVTAPLPWPVRVLGTLCLMWSGGAHHLTVLKGHWNPFVK